MSNIIQYQRRAIESLFKKFEKIITLEPKQRYFIGKKEIFFKGVSEGIGTCSDFHGVDLAVFANDPPNTKIPREIKVWGAVLIGDAASPLIEDARAFCSAHGYALIASEAVEKLKISKITAKKIFFKKTGRINTYVSI